MNRAALIITDGDADEFGRHHAQMPSEPSEQLLADLRTLLSAADWATKEAEPLYPSRRKAIDAAAARVRAALGAEKGKMT